MNTNKNVKAFTLIELLAVIVILAIIAIIAIPIILGIINDTKEKAFKVSLKNVEHAYSLYVAQHQEDASFDKNEEISVKELPLDSNLSGVVFTNEEGKIELKNITDGTYSASGTIDDINIIKGTPEELLKNLLTVKININQVTMNSITVTVETIEGIPTSYIYKIVDSDNKSQEKSSNSNTYTFDKLKANTEYTIIVTVRNKAGLTKEITKTGKTQTIDDITLDLTPKDEYIKEGKVTINYPIIEAGLINKYKWDEDEEFTPVTENSIEVEAHNGTLIAVILDGEEVVTQNSITINNIDDVDPVITLSEVSKTTNSITVPFTITEDHIDEITCKYSDTIDTYTSNGTIGDNACTLSNELKDNKTYYYQICVTDLAGNSDCKAGSTNTEEITNPEVSITHYNVSGSEITTPSTTSNGYSYKEVAKITFTSTNNPTYYIYSTAAGVTNNNVIGSCTEEDNLPKACSSISTTNIEADTWYKVNGDINITYATETETQITISAVTYDGKNFSTAGTGTTAKIDRTAPSISVNVVDNEIVITAEDIGSGRHSLAYKCEDSDWQESNICTFTDNQTYTVKVRDKLENESTQMVNIVSPLTPVVYKNNNWVVADTSKAWYDYENQEWGNAVVLKRGITKNVGDTVSVEGDNIEIQGMFVWIPRYEYKIEGKYGTHMDGTTGTETLPGEIKINFITKDTVYEGLNSEGYRIHPAFWWDDNSNGVRESGEELDGIWIGKFETTGTESEPTILPSVKSIVYKNIVTQFSIARKFKILEQDSHMAKNSEWGAAAYLSQSKYGKYGNPNYNGLEKEVRKNNCSSLITGVGANSQDEASSTETCTTNTYETVNGQAASTTGNITGIYDMNGGAYEYVMGVYKKSKNSSGFGTLPAEKYYDNYTTETATTACSSGVCYGHALSETSGWYGDSALLVNSNRSWMYRGGSVSSSGTGVFFFHRYDGSAELSNSTFRVVLVNNS